jgi:nucleotide-binding universal stress UspA family protein
MDISRVVVGADPSHDVSDALAFALGVADAAGADLLVASVTDATDDPDAAGADAALAAVDRAVAAGATGTLALRFRTGTFTGDPREVLVERAAAEQADLLVIGARGSGGFLGLGLGGVAHHLVHHSPCPLAVVPADPDPVLGSPLVVGVDGSASSQRALEWAIAVAGWTGGRVDAVFAHDPLADSYPHPQGENWSYRGEREAAAVVAGLSTEVPVSFASVAGPTVVALRDAATAAHASMIVVGTRGRGGFHGLVVGRVPVQLLHRAEHPVVVVPH